MFSKKTLILLSIVFAFLSIATLVINLPEHKNEAVMSKIKPYLPYKLTKTMGGLDIVEKSTGKKLKVDNAKVFLALDDLTKKWGKSHLFVTNNTLLILDDANVTLDTMKLNSKQRAFVHTFFGK